VSATIVRTSQVAIVGRAADELTRADLNPRRFSASLANHRRVAVQKEDGWFVFADLPASPPAYEVVLEGRQFQPRRLSVTATGVGAVEIDTDGEDELHVIVTDIDVNRVVFATVPFVPRIPAGAQAIGEGGFATTLGESIEGVDVDGAELSNVTGLAAGEVLRIIRGRRLLLRPGPYYPFPPGTTVAAIRVVDSLPGSEPVADAQVEISEVNAAPIANVVADGVTLFRADLPPAPNTPFMIGTLEALGTVTNHRGDAVFYYAPNTPVTSLTVSVSRVGYTTQTQAVAVAAGTRTSTLVQLVRS
jgi:hypothetical protein